MRSAWVPLLLLSSGCYHFRFIHREAPLAAPERLVAHEERVPT